MDSNDIRTRITIIDNEKRERVTILLILSLPIAKILLEDALKSNLKVIVEPVL